MVTPGTPHYSESFDMAGNDALLVEARLLGVPSSPPVRASVQVQGSSDAAAEKKDWVVEGDVLALSPGAWERRILRDVRGLVRVVAECSAPGGPDCIKIRITLLP